MASSGSVDDVLKSQQFLVSGTSRPELNDRVVYIVGNPGGGRLRVKLLDPPHTEYSIKAEHLKELGFVHTLKQAWGRLDLSEVTENAKILWRRPMIKVGLGVLAIAVVSSVGGKRGASAAPHNPSRYRGGAEFFDTRPPPHIAEAYALGYADAYKKRQFGASFSEDDDDEDHSDLVSEVLKDLPPESRGIRDEWAAGTGVGRKEPVGRKATPRRRTAASHR